MKQEEKEMSIERRGEENAGLDRRTHSAIDTLWEVGEALGRGLFAWGMFATAFALIEEEYRAALYLCLIAFVTGCVARLLQLVIDARSAQNDESIHIKSAQKRSQR